MVGKTVSHYKVLEKLGEGGMGVVYKAEDTKLRRLVALKFLPPQLSTSPDFRKRFLAEARAAAALSHPNICTVHEIHDEGDDAFLEMEYVEGRTLSDRVKEGPLEPGEAVAIAIQIADALEEAHRSGVIHRDIKSANIMVTPKGQAKVMDFGLARIRGETLHTKAGTLLGTAAYMSPEQARGESVDARADIWSLGVVTYEMLSGLRPFKGNSEVSILYSILNEEPKSLKDLKPDLPPELCTIASHALKKDLKTRYASAADMAQDLRTYQESLTAARLSVLTPRTLLRALRKPRIAVAAVLCLGLVGGAASWYLHRQSRIRWARNVALPEIARLNESEKFADALRLVQQAERSIAGDPELARLRRQCSATPSITITPAGADVAYKPYTVADAAWEPLGKTPLNNAPVPRLYLRWRITKDGFEPLETAGYLSVPVDVSLSLLGATPPGMVRVPGGVFSFLMAPPARLDDYWLDKYEVTNRQFKEFVDRGGYTNREYWKQPFVEGGGQIPWEGAVSRFRDATGRPGPATWELGTYPEGQADYPVSGVSWYEAAAYAEFAGKSLPTVYHWLKAAGISFYSDILQCSNFGGTGPVRVGSRQGLSPYGNYDMAGNVKEWCSNQTGDRRYILGGAYNEPTYMFANYDALPPFSRSPTFGFRCAKYSAPLASLVQAPIKALLRDYSQEKPVNDEVFRVYSALFNYDRTDLKPVIVATEDSFPYWRREKITFEAVYGGERVIAILFLPRNAIPPFQTVVYFPGSSAFAVKGSSNSIDGNALDFVMRSGRALLYPIYKGSYERGGGVVARPASGNAWREITINCSKDLGRSVDYLETRADIDRTRLAYYGLSIGGDLGIILTAVDGRFRAAVFEGAGLPSGTMPAEVDALNFAPRAKAPVLMLNGRQDFIDPLESTQFPLFRLLGAPEKDKRHVLFDTGHAVPRTPKIKEILDWLDLYLGPVKLQPLPERAAR